MSSYQKKTNFIDTVEGLLFKQALGDMVKDKSFNTQSSYSADDALYPNHLIPFVNKHMDFIRKHPNTDPDQYLSNLRLMTRIRI